MCVKVFNYFVLDDLGWRSWKEMKIGIYFEYCLVVFVDISIDFKFLLGFIKSLSEIIKWEDGNEYLLLCVEIFFDLYLFYIGK